MLTKLLSSSIGRLRILGFMEGTSLLILLFIAVPLKYGFGIPQGSLIVGPIHGILFLLFVAYTIYLAALNGWKIGTTLMLLIACILPFGTFYADKKILGKLTVHETK